MRWLILLLCSSFLAVGLGKKPNIIFLLTDDQGSADLGYRTPNSPFVTHHIDRIAGQAVRLNNYYVHPTCSPTRAALMSGRYAANVGLSLAIVPGNPAGLEPRYGTMAEHLEAEGYKNYLVGKWHLGQSMEKYHPLKRGFHEFYGLLGGGFNYYTKQCGMGRYDFWRGFEPEYENTTHATELLNAEALNVVKRHAHDKESEPFFLFLSHPAPHDPLMAPEKHQKLCGHIKNRKRMMSCAMVAGINEGFGDIIDVLEETGELENTIIAFSVDNGGVPYAGALNYPLRGAKSTQYEGGVKVPGFIYAPNILGRNKNFEGLFHVTDFLPTFSAMISASTEIKDIEELDGVNQLDSLVQNISSVETGVRQSVHIHRDIDRDSHAFRKGPWKLIVGYHFLPFLFNKIYNETESGWMVNNGNWRDKTLDWLLTLNDWLLGTQNTVITQYMWWMLFDAQHVGGLANAFPRLQHNGLYLPHFATNLTHWRARHTDAYPTVSLFNLDNDPQELVNLATERPELVESLLAEAEESLKSAPGMFRGDMVYKKGPTSPQYGLLSRLLSKGTELSEVIPYGPFLPDDFPLDNPDDFARLLSGTTPEIIIVTGKNIFVFMILPLLVLRFILSSFVTK